MDVVCDPFWVCASPDRSTQWLWCARFLFDWLVQVMFLGSWVSSYCSRGPLTPSNTCQWISSDCSRAPLTYPPPPPSWWELLMWLHTSYLMDPVEMGVETVSDCNETPCHRLRCGSYMVYPGHYRHWESVVVCPRGHIRTVLPLHIGGRCWHCGCVAVLLCGPAVPIIISCGKVGLQL